jgi:3-methyladenine DNA glycosylase AlkD
MVDVPGEVTNGQMEAWVVDFNSWDVCDQVCMNLFEKTPIAWEKIHAWSDREGEFVKRAAYALIACLAWHDKMASDEQFVRLMPVIKAGSSDPRNYVKKAVSWALRNTGKRNPHLRRTALRVAEDLRAMDSKPAKWIAADTVRDLNSEATLRRMEKF